MNVRVWKMSHSVAIMAPYKHKHRSNKIIDSQTHYSEIGDGDHQARVVQVQHVTGNCQNYPNPSQGHHRTTQNSKDGKSEFFEKKIEYFDLFF